MAEAKAKICLPMPLEEMVVGEAPRTPAGLASSLPAGNLLMNVTLALSISRRAAAAAAPHELKHGLRCFGFAVLIVSPARRAEFTAEKQTQFLNAIARQFKIPPGRLRILRKLLAGGIAVTVEVQSAPGSDAASVTSSIQSAVNSAALRREAFTFGDVPVSGGFATVNVPGAVGAVQMGDDSVKDAQLIKNLPGVSSILANINSTCAAITSCATCTATTYQCVWCAGACTSSASCITSAAVISDSGSCSFVSTFRQTFNTTQSLPDAFFTNQTVKDELAVWFESILSVQKGAVRILSLERGSVIVNGQVTSAESQAAVDGLREKLRRALGTTTAPRTIGGFTFLPACPGAGCLDTSGSTTTPTSSGDGTNTNAIIGGVVGGVGGAFLIAVIAGLCYCRRRSNQRKRTGAGGEKGKHDMESNAAASAPAYGEPSKAYPPPPPAPAPLTTDVRL
eukprot:tig00020830_g14466.t1